MSGRGYFVQEDIDPFRHAEFDPGHDSDFEPDEIKSEQVGPGTANGRP
jgi:hypothetical protein